MDNIINSPSHQVMASSAEIARIVQSLKECVKENDMQEFALVNREWRKLKDTKWCYDCRSETMTNQTSYTDHCVGGDEYGLSWREIKEHGSHFGMTYGQIETFCYVDAIMRLEDSDESHAYDILHECMEELQCKDLRDICRRYQDRILKYFVHCVKDPIAVEQRRNIMVLALKIASKDTCSKLQQLYPALMQDAFRIVEAEYERAKASFINAKHNFSVR